MKQRVTIIITTYNDSVDMLRRAVLSVVQQTLAPAEVIVVDDGSSSESARQLQNELLKNGQHGNIKFLFKENGGPSSARNLGVQHCETEWIAFLDSDDEMLPRNIEEKLQGLKDLGEDYFGVYGSYLINGGRAQIYRHFDGVADADWVGHSGHGIPGGVPTYVFRSEALKAVGGFDESLVNNEDFDLLIRLIRAGYKVKGMLQPNFIRNYRPESVSRSTDYEKKFRLQQKFLEKAERLNYFSAAELTRRKQAVLVSLARGQIKAGKLRAGLKSFAYAKHLHPATGIKQLIVFNLAALFERLGVL